MNIEQKNFVNELLHLFGSRIGSHRIGMTSKLTHN